MYYFPDEESASTHDRARAFVYKVRDDPTDPTRQIIEIVVDGGREFDFADLHVDVDGGDSLVVTGDRSRSRRPSWGASQGDDRRPGARGSTQSDEDDRQVIKRYALPARAVADAITSRRSDDGRLAILVPVRR